MSLFIRIFTYLVFFIFIKFQDLLDFEEKVTYYIDSKNQDMESALALMKNQVIYMFINISKNFYNIIEFFLTNHSRQPLLLTK